MLTYAVGCFGCIVCITIPVLLCQPPNKGLGTGVQYDDIEHVILLVPFMVLIKLPVRMGLFLTETFLIIGWCIVEMVP